MLKKKLPAFTMIEIVIVIAIFTVLLVLFLPIATQQFTANRVKTSASSMSSDVYVYQQKAYNRIDGESYGVSFGTNTYTLFTGTSLGAGTNLVIVDLAQNVTISNVNLDDASNEIVFSPGDLEPSTFGTITMTDGSTSYNLDVNAEGLIDTYKL
ncbi:type II secretion system protein [Candidatus Dojkabacteria bacterium]|uniref:Type II secretion system protein n=1 Tax=Candidatus Dojkabacteria bacterium TaxID=2099670 RepID=A0A955L5B1_9BACT|nr:type II secretion system protein [Candidatus Dojkabacteria bacterium]